MTETSGATVERVARINGRHCRAKVQARQPFRNSNGQLYAQLEANGIYAVYSYGAHWPLFAYNAQTDQWFENVDRCSVTTSKHRSFAHPQTCTIKVSKDELREIVARARP